MTDNVLELRKATKLYAGVPAIEDVDFALRRGEHLCTSGTVDYVGVEALPEARVG